MPLRMRSAISSAARADNASRSCRTSISPAMLMRLSFYGAPGTSITGQKIIGGAGAFAAGIIVGEVPGRRICPPRQYRLDHTPGGFDLIGALEQGRIADQTIIDQR